MPRLNELQFKFSTSLMIGLAIVLASVAYWPAVFALWRYWIDQPYLGGHGTLVAALAVWMLLRSRERIDSTPARSAPWALVLLVPCSIAALIFWKAGIQSLQVLMFPALIWLVVLASFGWPVARVVALPIAYLYFAMPIWNLVSVPLQDLTVRMVALISPAIGLPAVISGTNVSFPNGSSFVVTVACSGVGFLTQGLAVAALLGELEQARIHRRLILMASMVVIALVTNWVRVLLLLVIGYSAGMDNVIVAHKHLEFGYVLFVVVLVAFVWFSTRGTTPEPEMKTSSDARPALIGYIGALLALIAGPILVSVLTPSEATAALELRLPTGQDPWRGPLPAVDAQWHPVFVGAHAQQQGVYEDESGHTVAALAVGYAVQGQGHELVNEGNSILGDGDLSATTTAFVDVGDTTYLEDETVDTAGHRSIIWSVYDIGGKKFVVPLLSQLWYGTRALTGPPYSAQFAFRVACGISCDGGRGTLRSFVLEMAPRLLTRQDPAVTRAENLPAIRDTNSAKPESQS